MNKAVKKVQLVYKIAQDILIGGQTKELKPDIFYNEKSEPSLQQNIASFNTIGKEYTIHDSCIKCGLCGAVCPTQNISF